jgi:hypothetical protein
LNPRRAPHPSRVPLALLATALATAHCGQRVVDAVDLGEGADGGAFTVWPTASHGANSDPWLVAHHDSLVAIQPRVLVLDFYDHLDLQAAEQQVQTRISALAAGSRYHGYADPAAPAFLSYSLVKVIDLTDHPVPPNSAFESSALLPVDASGAFDGSALFTPSFAAHYGFPDPADPAQPLTLCQLFERGIINELWLMTGDEATSRRPPLMAESKQVYDAQGAPIPGMFEDTGYDPFPGPRCAVTARIAYVSPVRGIDCDLVARSAGIENTVTVSPPAIPYLTANASAFFDADFRARDGASFDSWAQLVAEGTNGWCGAQATACIDYPSETTPAAAVPEATGTFPDGSNWTMSPFTPGCGTSHFPPNARFEWDYDDIQPVRSRCEHYGLGDGPAGDVLTAYSSDMASVAAFTQAFGDDGCGAGWQIYYRQSMPGLGNRARAADGSPMKNWWPFLFY